jgi:putative membrane protein
MVRFIIRVLINALALWLTAQFTDFIALSNDILDILFVALIFGLVNAIIRPIVKLLTLPINILSLGLFTLVINMLMLWLTEILAGGWLDIAGDTFLARMWSTFAAALIISIISTVLNWIIPDRKN